MSDRYLWDRSGPADPEIAGLESLLSAYSYRIRRPSVLYRPAVWAAAACLLLVATLSLQNYRQRQLAGTCEIESRGSIVRVNGKSIGERIRLHAGDRFEVSGDSEACLRVGSIGEMNITAGSVMSVVRSDTSRQRFRLEQGRIHARIDADPYVFGVETPYANAIDMGCAYSLDVASNGSGRLQVASGWVLLTGQDTESLVPEGAYADFGRGHPPGLPVRTSASAHLKSAASRVGITAPPEALLAILENSTREDAATLVNLFWRVEADDRTRLYQRLAGLQPPPAGVTSERCAARDFTAVRNWVGSANAAQVLAPPE